MLISISDIVGFLSFLRNLISGRSKLKVESFEYRPDGYGSTRPRGTKLIESKILLKNKSEKSTTIEKIYADLGGYLLEPKFHSDGYPSNPIDVKGNSSRYIIFRSDMPEEEFERIKTNEDLEFSIYINHTFKKIKETKKVNSL